MCRNYKLDARQCNMYFIDIIDYVIITQYIIIALHIYYDSHLITKPIFLRLFLVAIFSGISFWHVPAM